MRMKLTNTACKNARTQDKPYCLVDGGGLYLRIQPNGSRLWRMNYRFQGKQKTLSFGKYPDISLSDARQKRAEAHELLKKGIDPAEEKKRSQRPIAQVNVQDSFEEMAREWHATKKHDWTKKYAQLVWNRLQLYVLKQIGHCNIQDLEPLDILAVLKKVEQEGVIHTVRRLREYISSIYRFAIVLGKVKYDPTHGVQEALKKPPRVQHYASLKPTEIPEFLKKLQKYDGDDIVKLGIWLTLFTFTRTSEVRFAQWQEFEDLDGPNPVWRIPAHRMKARREHLVPLAPQTLAVLAHLRQLSSFKQIFAAPTRHGVISENTMLYALYRMGYHSRLTIHGLRGTASTVLNEQGFNRDWIEMQLAHGPRDAVRAAYNSAEWLPGRREMMAWWANFLSSQLPHGLLFPSKGHPNKSLRHKASG